MERGFTLIANGMLTIASARGTKGVALPRTFNHATGKGSMRQTGFNDTTWGKATRSYAKLARSLPKSKFDNIIQGAQPYIKYKSNRSRSKTAKATGAVKADEDDERAHLPISDDDECKLAYFLVISGLLILFREPLSLLAMASQLMVRDWKAARGLHVTACPPNWWLLGVCLCTYLSYASLLPSYAFHFSFRASLVILLLLRPMVT